MVLLIDNFDSFTYNIFHYIMMCGWDCELLRNDEPVLPAIEQKKPSGIVFSPGPMRPADHPVMFDVIDKYHEKIPMLGICLGHQAIGEYFGADLVKAPAPVHGKVSTITHTGHPMYHSIPDQVEVARYHSLVLTGLENTPLEVTAHTADGLPMSMVHPKLPVWGVQYHPEAIQTRYGLQIMKNWMANLT